MPKPSASANRYHAIVEAIFLDRYSKGKTELPFERSDIEAAAAKLGIVLPKNLGDVVYSVRYRTDMPAAVVATQPRGKEWIVEGTGRARYAFRLVPIERIAPRSDLLAIKIPDATPEIIAAYALSDEQALLAKVRYNRLIDIFLGITCYSLQNHLRTTVAGIGQVEIDEVYVGLDNRGRQYVIPVQAKSGDDRHAGVQTRQDLRCCAEKFPGLICRAISTRFTGTDLIAMLELTLDGDGIKVVDEKQYRLVPADAIKTEDLIAYRR